MYIADIRRREGITPGAWRCTMEHHDFKVIFRNAVLELMYSNDEALEVQFYRNEEIMPWALHSRIAAEDGCLEGVYLDGPYPVCLRGRLHHNEEA